MVGIGTTVELVERYGLTLVLLVFFIYMYMQSNKDTLKLIIAIKDENKNVHNKNVESLYNIKDELKTEMGANTEKIIKSVVKQNSETKEVLNRVQDKAERIEMLLLIKRGEDK